MDSAFSSHIVPVVYLKAWRDRNAGQPAQVWLINKDSLAGYLCRGDKVLTEERFYWTLDSEGSMSDRTEGTLGVTESRFGYIRKQLQLGRDLDRDNHHRLWQFVMAMCTRTAVWRDSVRDLLADLQDRLPAILPREVQERLPPHLRHLMDGPLGNALVAQFLKENQLPLALTFAMLGPAVHARLIEKGIAVVTDFSLPFCIIDDPSESFLTSDTPCFLDSCSVVPVPTDGVARNVWYVALSPTMAFVGGKGIKQARQPVDARWVRTFNGRLRANASRWLVAARPNLAESDFHPASNAPPTMRELLHEGVKKSTSEDLPEP